MQACRISASGNRFIIVDFRKDVSLPAESCVELPLQKDDFFQLHSLSQSERALFIKKLQVKDMDGLAVIKKSEDASLSFCCEFYNKDGSTAEMCGNLSCCLVMYARQTKLSKKTDFKFFLGETEAQSRGKWVLLEPPSAIQKTEYIFNKTNWPYFFVNTGVPHAVIETELNPRELISLARSLRSDTTQSSSGMNVSFFKSKSASLLQALTFERGVESFTQACGTGALACATVLAQSRPELTEVKVSMPGGILEVKLQPYFGLFSQPRWHF